MRRPRCSRNGLKPGVGLKDAIRSVARPTRSGWDDAEGQNGPYSAGAGMADIRGSKRPSPVGFISTRRS